MMFISVGICIVLFFLSWWFSFVLEIVAVVFREIIVWLRMKYKLIGRNIIIYRFKFKVVFIVRDIEKNIENLRINFEKDY